MKRTSGSAHIAEKVYVRLTYARAGTTLCRPDRSGLVAGLVGTIAALGYNYLDHRHTGSFVI